MSLATPPHPTVSDALATHGTVGDAPASTIDIDQAADLADLGFGDTPAPSVNAARTRSTINVNVTMGSGDAASWNALDLTAREALRDALIDILRDDARRQGLDL
ncbi:MAG TPA: hypothetical protein VJ779_05725 [Acetobacteraceae bacterium]|nr:hypothetical protein [Acetobacteraceae bacterium]